MDFTNIFNPSSLAIIAPFVLFFKHIQTFVKKFFTFFVRTDTISGEHTRYFINYILENSKKIDFGCQNFTSEKDYSKKHKRYLGLTTVVR